MEDITPQNHHLDIVQKENTMPRGKAKKDATNGGITKWDAVKQALAFLGNDAMPLALRDHIKGKFGLDLDPSLISNYKSTLLKKNGGRKSGAKQRGRPAGSLAKAAPIGGGISVEDIKAIKQLVDRMGAEKVRELAQVLAR